MNYFLKIILITVIIKQLVWISFIPLWQFPDEQAHFGQVVYTSTGKPATNGNNLTAEILISERILGTERDGFGNNRYTYHPEYNIPYSNSTEGFFEKEITGLPKNYRQVMVKKEATSYPMLYYYFGALLYKLINVDLLASVFIVRFLNIIYSIVIVWFSFKTFALIFKESKFINLGIILVSFHPMLSFISAGINSDNIYNASSVVIVYLCVLMLKQGVNIKNTIMSVITVILALLSKPQAYILVLFFSFPVFKWLWINRRSISKRSILIAAVLLASPFVFNYFTRTVFFPDVKFHLILVDSSKFWGFLKWSLLQGYKQILPWYWGVFRWLSLSFNINVYRLINIISIFCLIGVFIFLYRSVVKRVISFKLITLIFFAYTFIIYFFSLTIWDFSFFLTKGFSFGIQGRYYFPLIAAYVGILLIGAETLGNIKIGLTKVLFSVFGLGIIFLHEYTLVKVVTSYYSLNNISNFFVIASQYKPLFFKSPILVYLLLIHLITILILSSLFITYDSKKSLS